MCASTILIAHRVVPGYIIPASIRVVILRGDTHNGALESTAYLVGHDSFVAAPSVLFLK